MYEGLAGNLNKQTFTPAILSKHLYKYIAEITHYGTAILACDQQILINKTN